MHNINTILSLFLCFNFAPYLNIYCALPRYCGAKILICFEKCKFTKASVSALQWLHDPDLYDCRSRSWYIEASTCSKDVVILVDTTGSMTGMRHYIARLTVNSLLDTFSNNDFVNVFNFSSHAQEVVPCFKDTLVQVNSFILYG